MRATKDRIGSLGRIDAACGEHPELPLRIDGAVQTVTPKLVCGLQQHICACCARSSAVRIDVIHVDVYASMKSAQRLSAGHRAESGPNLAEHYLPGSVCKLRMCQAALWRGAFEDPREAERAFEKSRSPIDVIVKEVGHDIRWSQRGTHLPKLPLSQQVGGSRWRNWSQSPIGRNLAQDR